jgi:predicted kinase
MFFAELLARLPLVDRLKNLPQDMKWHPEGSVYTHIMMVARFLPEEINLQISAIFHDLGKINTFSVVEKENKIKIQNKGHETLAQKYIEQYKCLYYDLPINWDLVSYVCLNHMRMHKYNNNEMTNPEKRKEIENHEYFEYLKLFARADEMMSKLTYESVKPYLICTFGIPGSGKSTWARAFAARSGYVRICPDDIREEITGNVSDISKDNVIWDLAYERIEKALESRNHVIFDATNVNPRIRAKTYSLFGEKSTILWKIFECDDVTAKKRIKKDIDNGVNRSNVPEHVVDRMYEMYKNSLLWTKSNFVIEEYKDGK